MPEMQNIEWKTKWKDEYLEWICGFANAQGGKIYIGCDDNGHVIGLDNTRRLLEDIPNKIRSAMSIVVDVNLLRQDGKEYIEITVPSYPVAISCKGVYYYRSGSTMQTLSGAELESFILRKRGASWDSMPIPGFTINDIDCLQANTGRSGLQGAPVPQPYGPRPLKDKIRPAPVSTPCGTSRLWKDRLQGDSCSLPISACPLRRYPQKHCSGGFRRD